MYSSTIVIVVLEITCRKTSKICTDYSHLFQLFRGHNWFLYLYVFQEIAPGLKFQRSGWPRGRGVNPEVLHWKGGCCINEGPLEAMHD